MVGLMVVWVHLLAAIFWIGGMLFLALIVVPSLRGIPPPDRTEWISRIGRRFRSAGWIALGILIVTGALRLRRHSISIDAYGQALWVKLILVLLMVGLSAIHDFVLGPRSVRISRTSPDASGLQRAVRWMARINLLVGLFVVLAAAWLVRGG